MIGILTLMGKGVYNQEDFGNNGSVSPGCHHIYILSLSHPEHPPPWHHEARASGRAERSFSLPTSSALAEAFAAGLSTLALLFRKAKVWWLSLLSNFSSTRKIYFKCKKETLVEEIYQREREEKN